MRTEGDEFIPTRQSLLSRLRDWDDQESWRDFFDTYGRFIYGIARKSSLNDPEAQDVVQDTLLAVARQMPGFKYDPSLGSFKGWLRRITHRRVVDTLRRHRPEFAVDPAEFPALEGKPHPAGYGFDSLWEEEWQHHLLRTAMARVRQRVHPRQYQMFDLYVTQEWPIKSVMNTLGVSAAQIYMAKMRISRMIKAEVALLRTEMA